MVTSLKKKYPKFIESSADFQWLSNFKENEYKELNDKRKIIVHYFYIETQLFHDFLSNTRNKEELNKIEKEFYSYDQYFKSHLKFCIEGFEKALMVIEANKNKADNRVARSD